MTAMSSNCSRIDGLSCRAFARGAMRTVVCPSSARRHPMNWDQIQGNWMLFKANVRGNWVKLTDEDLTRVGGRREELVKRLQARYGFGKGEAEREIEAWVKTQRFAA
jgi:uncharacterized protein YjbJ (UPF0337 family)